MSKFICSIEPPKLGKVNLPHQIPDIQIEIENLALAFFFFFFLMMRSARAFGTCQFP